VNVVFNTNTFIAGVRALYCGLAPTLIRTFFASGALFVAYEYTTKTLHAVID
jgi:solute carrier family 25 ornithine transporter 2/15